MAVSFGDALASTCPRFVEVLRLRHYRLGIDRGAVCYLKSSNDTVVRVGESASRSPHNLKYIADVAFIKKYSVLFELGEQFQWEKAREFEDWLASIVNARPKFIPPFCRSVNALPAVVSSPHDIDHHYCWFVDIVQIRDHMTVSIPEEFVPYDFAPPEAVVIIHSGSRYFHVKLKNDKLTVGWDHVALAHNLGRNYILMFGLVGHLQFDLFVFDEEGCEVSYDWSTTLPIHQANAPIGWDAELAMCNANGSVALTACPPSSFRAPGMHCGAIYFCRLLILRGWSCLSDSSYFAKLMAMNISDWYREEEVGLCGMLLGTLLAMAGNYSLMSTSLRAVTCWC